MGFALAEAALTLGAEITLISGPVALLPPSKAKFISIQSTAEMFKAVESAFPQCDCLIMAAAPADFAVGTPAASKLKKKDAGLNLKLQPTIDILLTINRIRKHHQRLVGFALETTNGEINARQKLADKKLDMIVLNEVGSDSGFDSDTNRVTVLTPSGESEQLPLASKSEIARQLLDRIAALL